MSPNKYSAAIISSFLVLAIGVSAHADITMVGRSSRVTYDFVYGFGGDTVTGADDWQNSDFFATDSISRSISAGNSGFYPPLNDGWDTWVDGQFDHQYSVSSFPSGVMSISASGSTTVTSFESGIGVSVLNSLNPGNELILYFDVTDTRPFNIQGGASSSYTGPSDFGHAYVRLEYFNGSFWAFGGFFSEFLPDGGIGSWSVDGTLIPGQYRLIGGAFSRAFGSETFTETYNFTFTSVPEPTLGILGGIVLPICATLIRRRRSSTLVAG